MKRWLSILLAALMALGLTACGSDSSIGIIGGDDGPTEVYVSDEAAEDALDAALAEAEAEAQAQLLAEDGSYSTKEDVALYISQYGHLPCNYITKLEAQDLGWEGGSLEPYAPGMCIGGNRFGNYEGLLPEADGRIYTECDIDTLGADSRGAKRLVFSNDGLIFYTEDHYESFELLYGDIEYEPGND